MLIGYWDVDNDKEHMPEKIENAFNKLRVSNGRILYNFIAYLGWREARGSDHAVLAEQDIIAPHGTDNIVILIFNDRGDDTEASLIAIERVVDGGAALGRTIVDVTRIDALFQDEYALKLWHEATDGHAKISMTPFACLGRMVGIRPCYIYIATAVPEIMPDDKQAVLVKINPMAHTVHVDNLLADEGTNVVDYGFTW